MAAQTTATLIRSISIAVTPIMNPYENFCLWSSFRGMSMEQGNIIAGGSSETGVDNAGTLCLRYIIAVCELDRNWSVTHQID